MLNRILLASVIIVLASCHTKNVAQPDYAALKYEKGIMKDFELDGCRFMIEVESGKRLNPDKLDSTFTKDQMKVWIKYKPQPRMNICMSGETVNVIDIQPRKE
jgi:hypothetical protein